MTDKLDNLEYAIVSLLQENQPKMLRWIEVVKCLWSDYKFRYETEKGFGVAVTNKLNLLVGSGKVKHEGIHYGTPSSTIDKSLSKAEAENIIKIVEEARHALRFFREPKVEDIARKFGSDPKIVRPLLYELASLTGWKEQSEEEAEREAEDAINLASWLCLKEKGEQNPKLEELSKRAINNASVDTLRRAKDILKNYPDLVPKVNLNGLEWPEETKIKWRQIFGSKPPAYHHWGEVKILLPPRGLAEIIWYNQPWSSF